MRLIAEGRVRLFDQISRVKHEANAVYDKLAALVDLARTGAAEPNSGDAGDHRRWIVDRTDEAVILRFLPRRFVSALT